MMSKILLVLLLPLVALAQQESKTAPPSDIWQPLRYFAGTWQGTAKGESGEGTVEREYRFTLQGKFLEVRNKSTYPPQTKNPKGEVHEDLGFFSYDKARKKLVLRQFHGEGFVNQYVLTNNAADRRTLVFETESIENIPSGWRARETYKVLNEREFTETFELAAPGKEFSVYSQTHFRRK